MELSYEIQQGLVGQLLAIESYAVGVYPISYTVEECLNDFCDRVKWELDTHTFTTYDSYMGGMMIVDLTNHEVSYRTILGIAEHRLIYEMQQV